LVTMVAIFGTAGVLPTEFESGSFYALLPRPISRTQVFLGKLLGALIVLWGLSLAMTGGLALSFILFLKLPPGFGWVVLLYPLGPTALAVLAFALSTRMRAMGAGFLTIFLSFVAGILPALDRAALGYGRLWLKAVVGLFEVLLPLGALPNWQSKWVGLIDGRGALDQAASSLLSPQLLTPWAFAWILLIFFLGARSFQRRNL
jgi:ABC-type transport system involved in multi-copper enzyme maturation permease subunit